jgi:hypothetical protein
VKRSSHSATDAQAQHQSAGLDAAVYRISHHSLTVYMRVSHIGLQAALKRRAFFLVPSTRKLHAYLKIVGLATWNSLTPSLKTSHRYYMMLFDACWPSTRRLLSNRVNITWHWLIIGLKTDAQRATQMNWSLWVYFILSQFGRIARCELSVGWSRLMSVSQIDPNSRQNNCMVVVAYWFIWPI